MADKVPIVWDYHELDLAIKNLMKVVPERTQEAIEQSCAALEAEAKERCPVDTGELRRSITHEVDVEDGGNVVGRVGTNLYYACFVHEGTGIYAKNGNGRKEVPWCYKDENGVWHKTSGSKPQPFLQEAVDAKKEEIAKYFRRIVRHEHYVRRKAKKQSADTHVS